jgi:hypothetical protein
MSEKIESVVIVKRNQKDYDMKIQHKNTHETIQYREHITTKKTKERPLSSDARVYLAQRDMIRDFVIRRYKEMYDEKIDSFIEDEIASVIESDW